MGESPKPRRPGYGFPGLLFLVPALAFSSWLGATEPFPPGTLTERVACRSDPTQTYTLYLPSKYPGGRLWPALLIFDPRGRGTVAADIFCEAAERYGWLLLSSDNTRSDGPFEPNARAVTAMWPEVHRRFATDDRRIYATGFSGGAIVAWLLAHKTGALAGVIGSGGRINPGVTRDTFTFAHFGAAGTTDFNYAEMRRVDAILEAKGLPHRLEIFEGPHTWMPPDLAREAVEWMELLAMRQGRRETDPGLVAELFAQDMTRAAALESLGRPLDAKRRYEAIARTFAGLHETPEASRRAAALETRAAREKKEEDRWDAWERSYLERDLPPALGAIRSSETPVPLAKILGQLQLGDLQERAKESSYAGVVARRVLATIVTDTSFYLTRDLLQEKQYARAVLALQVAAAIEGQDPLVQYNLACALALAGRKREALEALGRAVDSGFRDRRLLDEDPDLDSLRREPGFDEVRARVGDTPPR